MRTSLLALLCAVFVCTSNVAVFADPLPPVVMSAADLASAHDLNVGAGSTVVLDLSNTNSVTLPGALNNSGTIYAVSTTSGATGVTVNANSIQDSSGGLFTTIVPSGGIPGLSGLSGLVSGLALTLNSATGFFNAGTISSAGNLNITAVGDITNHGVMSAVQNLNVTSTTGNILNSGTMAAQQAANISAMLGTIMNSGTMSAMQSLNVASATINNTGLLQSLQNNVVLSNILSSTNSQSQSLSSTLNITNRGTIEALNGAVNVDAVNADLVMTDGTVSARNVNFSAPTGNIDVRAERINGDVGVLGCNALLSVNSGTLNVTSMNLSSDPVFANASGPVNLTVNDLGNTGGQNFIAVSGSDVNYFGSPTTLGTSGGTAIIGAGVTFDNNFNITGSSQTGGSINMSDVSITTERGSIVLRANAGTNSQGDISIGQLTTDNVLLRGSAGAVNANASGSISIVGISARGGIDSPSCLLCAGGNGGSINVTAGGAIQIGAINTTGGSVVSSNARNTLAGSGGNVTLSGASVSTGSITTNGGDAITLVPSYAYRTWSGRGGMITINSGGTVDTGALSSRGGNISSTSGATAFNGGNIGITADGDVAINGDVNSQTGSVLYGRLPYASALQSGSVSITSGGNISAQDVKTNSSTGQGVYVYGSAGNITLDAAGTLTAGVIEAKSENMTAGNITLSASNLNISGGVLATSGDTGGAISITTTGGAPLVVGAMTGSNYVGGDVDSAGIWVAPDITIKTNGGLTLTGSHYISAQASMSAANSGNVYLTGNNLPMNYVLTLDGVASGIGAKNIIVDVGDRGSATISGDGSLYAFDYVKVGNYDYSSGALLPSMKAFSISSTVNVLNHNLETSVVIPDPSPEIAVPPVLQPTTIAAEQPAVIPPVLPVPTLSGRIEQLAHTGGDPIMIPTDKTPLGPVHVAQNPNADKLDDSSDTILDVATTDGAEVSMLDPSQLPDGTMQYTMHDGKFVFAPHTAPAVLQADRARVSMAKNALVFVTEDSNMTAILNLHDSKNGDVRVKVAGNEVVLYPGQELIVPSSNAAAFEDVHPLGTIGYRRVNPVTFADGTKGYVADFSILSAMHHLSALRTLASSNTPHARSQFNNILKNAAIQATLTSAGSFSRGR